jgi:uncharacterized protein (TIGR02391 family)
LVFEHEAAAAAESCQDGHAVHKGALFLVTVTLLQLFPQPDDLLALDPEELAGALIEVIPSVSQSAGFNFADLTNQVFRPDGSGYPSWGPKHDQAIEALAEALAWLQTQIIIVRNPSQPSEWFQLTRRGRKLLSRGDVQAFRKGRTLPLELLQPALAEKVHYLFLRGDYDTAVFQAFKEVEVAVRTAASLPTDLLGKDLMMKAFNHTGRLRDTNLAKAEAEAEMFLFAGGMGRGKNPSSHRAVGLGAVEAARLIIFASFLLEIVEQRAAVMSRSSPPP